MLAIIAVASRIATISNSSSDGDGMVLVAVVGGCWAGGRSKKGAVPAARSPLDLKYELDEMALGEFSIVGVAIVAHSFLNQSQSYSAPSTNSHQEQ